MFSATDMRGTAAFFSGSSGRPKTLNRSKSLRTGSNGWSWMKMRPSRSGRWPDRTSTSAAWPLPDTPAMPTISPAPTLRLTPSTAGRPASSSAKRPASSSTVFGARVLRPGRRARGSRCRRSSCRAMASGVMSLTSAAADIGAAPQHRDRVARRPCTSRNLWLIISTVSSPRSVMPRSSPSTSSASSGVSTEVGSSRIRKRWSR